VEVFARKRVNTRLASSRKRNTLHSTKTDFQYRLCLCVFRMGKMYLVKVPIPQQDAQGPVKMLVGISLEGV